METAAERSPWLMTCWCRPGNPYGPALGWLWLNATANLLAEGPSAGPLFFSLYVPFPRQTARPSEGETDWLTTSAFTTATSSP